MNKTTLLVILVACSFIVGCSKRFMPLFEKAKVSYAEGNWVETIDHLNLALPFWRESDGQEAKAQAYQLLGKAYHKLKKIDKASEAYANAIELSNNTYDSAYELGMIHLTSKQTKSAIESFKNALKMKKDDPWALVGLGNAYYDEGRYSDARIVYQRVLDSSPGVREATEFLRLIDNKAKSKTVTRPTNKKPARNMRMQKR